MITPAIVDTMQGLLRANGTLQPAAVLNHARAESSPLHNLFEWNDGAAAEAYRLDQARRLIQRVKIEIVPRPELPPIRTRMFVSLASDRVGGNGYRNVETVLITPDQRADLLRTALAELNTFRDRFRMLSELAGVFAELDRVIAARAESKSEATDEKTGKSKRRARG